LGEFPGQELFQAFPHHRVIVSNQDCHQGLALGGLIGSHT
jgi:hypothetical protein